MAKTIALLCAAGIGSRMQAKVPKQYLPLTYQGKEQALLAITLAKFVQNPAVDATIIALAANDTYCQSLVPEWFSQWQRQEVKPQAQLQSLTSTVWDEQTVAHQTPVYACWGYGARIHTVYSLLSHALEVCLQHGWSLDQVNVLIHDIARVGIRSNDLAALIALAQDLPSVSQILATPEQVHWTGILPGIPCVDSARQIKPSEQAVTVVGTFDRNEIFLAQTPQTFNLVYLYYLMTKLFVMLEQFNEQSANYHPSYEHYLALIPELQALEKSDLGSRKFKYNSNLQPQEQAALLAQLTDEVSVMHLYGEQVRTLELGKHNLKVTLPEDLALAQFYLEQEP